jgi:hypothetical protein
VLAGKERAPVVCSSTSFVMPIWKPRHRPPISTCSSPSMTLLAAVCTDRPAARLTLRGQAIRAHLRRGQGRSSRSGFRARRGGRRSGDFAAIRPQAFHRAQHDMQRIHLFASPRPCRTSSPPPGTNGQRPASQRDRLRLRFSRLCAFRAEIPQAVWLFAERARG